MKNPRCCAILGVLGLLACGKGGTGDDTESGTTEGEGGSTASGSEATGGGEGGDEALFGSGTRLKASYWDAGDGATRLMGWHDTELDIDCQFHQVQDWTIRCMPPPANLAGFSDAACERPIISGYAAGCGVLPELVSVPLPERCSGAFDRVEAVRIGAEVDVEMVYRMETGSCVPGWMPAETETFFSTTQVAPTMFTAAALEHPEVDGGLAVRKVTGEDGSFQRVEPALAGTETWCTVREVAGVTRCTPGFEAYDLGILHTDDACTEGGIAYATFDAACGDPLIVLRHDPSSAECSGEPWAYLEPGPEAETVYDEENGCMPPDASDDRRFFTIGGPWDPEQAPRATEVHTGTGRVRAVDVGSAAGVRVASGYDWYDTELERPCYPEQDADGATRCVPSDRAGNYPGISSFWGDATCEAVPLVSHGGNPCDPEPPSLVTTHAPTEPGSCSAGALTNVHELGEPHDGPVYQLQDEAGTCVEATSPPAMMFLIGAELGLDHLVEMTQVRDG